MLVFDTAPFKATITPEGYLSGDAIATRTGVFDYIMPDGSVQKQLRHPDDVLTQDSLATLKHKPVTDDHPLELVNVDNAGKYGVGFTGDTVRVDKGNIGITFSVTNKDTIMKIVGKKKRELSLGYNLDLVEEAGEYEGQPYTHRQTNIRYNHLAIVEKGRAGREARINMDGVAIQLHQNDHVEDLNMDKPLSTVNLDGIDYTASPEVKNALEKAQEVAKQAQANLDAAQAKQDEAQASFDAYKAEFNADSIAQAVNARVALMAEASKVINLDAMGDKTDRQIQEAVILSKHPALNLDGLSNDYVKARYDAVMEAVPSKEAEALAKQRQSVGEATNKDAAVQMNMAQKLNQKFHGDKK
jgi:uncharacterized protein